MKFLAPNPPSGYQSMDMKGPVHPRNPTVPSCLTVTQNIKAWLLHIQWLYLILGFIAITSIFYACSFLTNSEIEWQILLFLNPLSSVPGLDGLMILITDFSIFGFGIAFFSWEIAYQASKRSSEAKKTAEQVLKIIGMFFSVITISAYSWAGYTHSAIFIPLGLLIFSAYWFIGNTMTQYSEKKLQGIDRLFWITLSATVLTELAAECFIKDWVGRPRPLSHIYGAYHEGLRIVADEVVQGGHSYVSGHSSAFFAMITPMMYFVDKKQIKMGLMIWASVHAFSRIYLAAHFPYDSMMGGILGFSMATLVRKTHKPEWLKVSLKKIVMK